MRGLTRRVRQFWRAVRASLTEADWLTVCAHLNETEVRLFRGMAANDQQHSLRVMRWLLAKGYRDPALLKAALLHDVGKAGAQMRLFHRVTGVLAEWVSPALLERLASPRRESWRYPYHVYLRHAELGARVLERSGTAQEVVQLVRGLSRSHGVNAEAGDLRALRTADDAN